MQRQYSGTAGRIENCQVGVFLAYASGKGGRWWTGNCTGLRSGSPTPGAVRRRVPEQVGFHTKPQLAQAMLERALDAGVPAGWVTADEVDGGDARLRAFLEQRDVAYVLAFKATQPLWPTAGRVRPRSQRVRRPVSVRLRPAAQVQGASWSSTWSPNRITEAKAT